MFTDRPPHRPPDDPDELDAGLVDFITRAWRSGWMPADLLAAVGHSCTTRGVRLVAALMQREHHKQRYGDRLAFWGTVSLQRTMSRGSPADVREEVRTRSGTVGCDGGLFLAPAHVLPPETPWENIVAFFEAADEPI